ncbi:ABC transporter permease [Cohnella lupini]|uniref:Putative ABC transport system permease protein n=1 Tax=Cohnella lupini TaxID=1294267 RepID=A0A3D9HUH9_9BACL|nr:ABC transporter permease [Cohnella lupini]RED53164.1 putative ABC transport system permease protein [Cohnella lupini]
MKSYGAMAGRYLKQQRRKSILTIVGILLSVALISALGTMGQALKDNVILNAKYNDGSFYFGYTESSPDLYAKLEKHILVDQLGIYRKGGEIPLQDDYSITIDKTDKDGFRLLPIHLQDGRMPTAKDEIVVEQWILDRLPGTPKLNGVAELKDTDGTTRSYRIVGVLNNQQTSQTNGSSKAYAFSDSSDIALDSGTQLLLTLKPGVDINQQIESFKKLNPSFFTNDDLLIFMGESGDSRLNSTLMIIFSTLVGLVVLSTVAVIYNAFHIAVLERIRQFGLLRTIGASPGQIRSIVFREATVLSAIGVPLGLLVGWFGLWFTLSIMTQNGMKIMTMDSFELTFHWWIMGGSFIIGFAAVYLAAWLPARKASSVSPVEAVKGAGSIVRESFRHVRTPSLLSLMGIEGRMASNNIRRNRAKFRITTFSIVISVTLFVVFHYFTQQSLTMTTTTNENDRLAFQLLSNSSIEEDGSSPQLSDVVSDNVMRQLGELPGVYRVYGNYQKLNYQVLVPDEKLNKDYVQKTGNSFERINDRNTVYSDMYLYDTARLKEAAKYLQSGTVDPMKLAEGDGVILVQTVKPMTVDDKRELMPITRYKVGDKLTVMGEYSASPTARQLREVTVAGILKQSPFESPYQENTLVVIATKPTFAKLVTADSQSVYTKAYGTARLGLDIAIEDGANSGPIKQELEQIARTIPGSRLVDIAAEQKETRNYNLQMKIFVYSFLSIIGVIGSLNIINTVQTNLLLRRKEIGLLQAVGMTMGQIRRMASAEGVWFGVIGSFWGILLGLGLSYFLYKRLNYVRGFPFDFPWEASLIACGIAMLVGLLSVQTPLRRMAKANLLEELREEA